jgi:hypothetical protein
MQAVLAWSLQRSLNVLVISGIASIEHLRENSQASKLRIPSKVIAELEAIGKSRPDPYREEVQRCTARECRFRVEKMPFPNDERQKVLSRRKSTSGIVRTKTPREAIDLYNDFIQVDISRRAFMDGMQRLAAGLAAATASMH